MAKPVRRGRGRGRPRPVQRRVTRKVLVDPARLDQPGEPQADPALAKNFIDVTPLAGFQTALANIDVTPFAGLQAALAKNFIDVTPLAGFQTALANIDVTPFAGLQA
ncbi:hypothetical protein ACFYPF_28730, partial [Micromonospora sp. NPDC005223]|uniref:hypothetical protein n=1 Tax=Micromonospora sp. NPDC005223 TaxID=3364227 RepID=UPI0036C2A649